MNIKQTKEKIKAVKANYTEFSVGRQIWKEVVASAVLSTFIVGFAVAHGAPYSAGLLA